MGLVKVARHSGKLSYSVRSIIKCFSAQVLQALLCSIDEAYPFQISLSELELVFVAGKSIASVLKISLRTVYCQLIP